MATKTNNNPKANTTPKTKPADENHPGFVKRFGSQAADGLTIGFSLGIGAALASAVVAGISRLRDNKKPETPEEA